VSWHKSGRLIALEKKWGIPPSPYLQQMHDKYK
jgi:polar amino acid transport system substrate-binding protein